MITHQDCQYKIIDCHTHPDKSALANGWFLPPTSMAERFDFEKSCGVDRCCGSVISFEKFASFADVVKANRAALEIAKDASGFYYPGIHIHPGFAEESCRELETCVKKHGVRWVGELVGYINGYGDDYAAAGSDCIYALAAELGVPVNIHCGNLEVVAKLCRDFPKLNVVLAHPGDGKQLMMERTGLVASFPNLYLDLSGSGVMRYGFIRAAVDLAGANKILFGTDFPICNPAMYVHCVLSEPLTQEERIAIFSGNFKRLTGLNG
jgi:predicted TIM-barrel fold metal-dependent hydrolase